MQKKMVVKRSRSHLKNERDKKNLYNKKNTNISSKGTYYTVYLIISIKSTLKRFNSFCFYFIVFSV